MVGIGLDDVCYDCGRYGRLAGFRAVDPRLYYISRSMGVSPLQTFFLIRLPAPKAHIYAGMKISVVEAVEGVIIAEFIASSSGLGYMIMRALDSYGYDADVQRIDQGQWIGNGSIEVDGSALTKPISEIDIVCLDHLLLDFRTSMQNGMLQQEIRKLDKGKMRARAMALFEQFDLLGAEDKYPCQLSGGMRQRVSIVRALVHRRCQHAVTSG